MKENFWEGLLEGLRQWQMAVEVKWVMEEVGVDQLMWILGVMEVKKLMKVVEVEKMEVEKIEVMKMEVVKVEKLMEVVEIG